MDDSRISQLNLSNQLSGVEQVPISQFSEYTGATHTVHTTVDEIKNYVIGEFADAFCPIGTITPYAGVFSDNISSQGWLLCDGREVLQVDYPKLFERIGFTYGVAGEGLFKLPNMKGRVVTGYCSTSDFQEFDMVYGGGWPVGRKVSLGSTGGEYYRKLLARDVPLDDLQLNIPTADQIQSQYQTTAAGNYIWKRIYTSGTSIKLTQVSTNAQIPSGLASLFNNTLPPKIKFKLRVFQGILRITNGDVWMSLGSSGNNNNKTWEVEVSPNSAGDVLVEHKGVQFPKNEIDLQTRCHIDVWHPESYNNISTANINSSTVNILTPTDLNTPTTITQPYMVMNYIIKY
jgi:microcystin-dependent protein